jgi:hypothetical protein
LVKEFGKNNIYKNGERGLLCFLLSGGGMAKTFFAPDFFRTLAALFNVAPVVATSSTNTRVFPFKGPPSKKNSR